MDKTRILIVDDIEANRYLLQSLLEGNGYTVVTTSNGREAMESAVLDPPAIIISDILMPVMDGFTLCRYWKKNERLKSIPFVFYTATYTDPKDEEFALHLGADRFIIKPQEPEVFLAMLRHVLEQFQSGQLTPPSRPALDELMQLREYNQALARKLEDKITQMEEANAVLRDKEMRLRTIIGTAPECVKVLDQAGQLVEINEAGLQMIEAEQFEQVAGAQVVGLVVPEHRNSFNLLVRDVFDGKSRRLEFEIVGLRGTRRWLETHAVPLKEGSDQVTGLLGVTRDITEKRNFQQALEERNRFIEGVLQAEPGTVYVFDLKKQSNVYINEDWRIRFGYSAEETQAMGADLLPNIVHPDDLASIAAHIESWRNAPEGARRDLEYRVRTKSGEYRWLHTTEVAFARNEAGTVTQILGVAHDVTDKKLAAESVLNQKSLLESITQNLPRVYLSVIYSDYSVGYTSGGAFDDLDVTPGAFVGRQVADVFRPYGKDVLEKVLAHYKKTFDGDPQEFQLKLGEEWQEYRTVPLRNAEGRVERIVVVVENISERRAWEEALRNSEIRARALFDNAPLPIWVEDLSEVKRYIEAIKDRTEDLEVHLDKSPEAFKTIVSLVKVERINRKGLDFFGVGSLGDLMSNKERFFTPETWKTYYSNILAFHVGRLSNTYETRLRDAKGEMRSMVVNASLPEEDRKSWSRVYVSCLDITERKKNEKALQAQLLWNELLLQTTLDGYILADQQGHILEVNPSYCRMIGYTRDELTAMNIRDLEARLSPDEIAARIARFVERGVDRFETTHIRKDGGRLDLDVSIAAVQSTKGPRVAAFVRDVTEQKAGTRALAESREQYRDLVRKLEHTREDERKRIAREIHDELGQALTGLKMDAAWIERHSKKKNGADPRAIRAKAKEMSGFIDETIQHVRRLTSELRPGILDNFGLVAAIRWQADEFSKKHGIKVRVATDRGEPAINDEVNVTLFRVFQECLTNVARHSKAKNVHARLGLKDDVVTLTIRDDGVGIAASKIRDFSSLGLLGMRERVELLGGKLVIQKRKRTRGTEVQVTVPLAAGPGKST